MTQKLGADRKIFKPLLISCCPENSVYELPSDLTPQPETAPWEIAVSQSLQSRGYLKLLSSTIWRLHTAFELDRLISKLDAFDFVAVSPISLNSLAKFALGIRDSLPSTVMWAAAEKGLPIFIDDSVVHGIESLKNPHFVRIYKKYWQDIITGTIRSFAPGNLSECIRLLARHVGSQIAEPSGGRTVITRDDVLIAFKAAVPILIKPGAIVTDLARDEAEKLGVSISTE